MKGVGSMTKAQFVNKMYEAICRNHGGKMEGMWSLSTSCRLNKYCQARHKNGNSICSKCFAIRQTDWQHELANKLERNTELLTENEIPAECMPDVSIKDIFRLESFGDLNNVMQIKNYFTFAEANKGTIFGLWTKNTFLFPEVRKAGIKKPSNVIIIESAPLIDTPIEPSDEWVDKVFIVWSKKYKNEPWINCGKAKCIGCRNCYDLDGPKVINEVVK